MRISCIVCGKEYQSLLIEQEKAWAEVYGNMIQHVSLSHPKLFKDLQSTSVNAQMAIATYVSIVHVVKETERSPWLNSRLEKIVDSIMLAIGYEVAQDEEEEEEKEEKEDTDEETETEQPDPLETDKQEVSTE